MRSITWRKDNNRGVWRGDNGMIITNESFNAGGICLKFFPVYESTKARSEGNNFAFGESLAEAKRKAGELK